MVRQKYRRLDVDLKHCCYVIVLSPQPNPKITKAKTFWIEMGSRTDTMDGWFANFSNLKVKSQSFPILTLPSLLSLANQQRTPSPLGPPPITQTFPTILKTICLNICSGQLKSEPNSVLVEFQKQSDSFDFKQDCLGIQMELDFGAFVVLPEYLNWM